MHFIITDEINTQIAIRIVTVQYSGQCQGFANRFGGPRLLNSQERADLIRGQNTHLHGNLAESGRGLPLTIQDQIDLRSLEQSMADGDHADRLPDEASHSAQVLGRVQRKEVPLGEERQKGVLHFAGSWHIK